MFAFIFGLVATFTFSASAGDVVDSNGFVGVGGANGVAQGGLLELLQKAQPEQLVLGNVCLPNQVPKDRGQIVQYVCQMRDGSAGSLLPSGQFCEKWADLEHKINEISRATGYPSAVMECTYLIESRFKPGLTSPAGAKGLSQFMPTTASDLCRSVESKPKLREMFELAEKNMGNGTKTCTADALLGKNNDTATQLLGTPMFYRQYYGAFEKTWADLIQQNPARAKDFYHFLVIGYNAGPKVAEKFMHAVQRHAADPLAGLPAETKKYTESLDDCMMKPGSGVGRPGGTRSDCRNLQKGSHACAAKS